MHEKDDAPSSGVVAVRDCVAVLLPYLLLYVVFKNRCSTSRKYFVGADGSLHWLGGVGIPRDGELSDTIKV